MLTVLAIWIQQGLLRNRNGTGKQLFDKLKERVIGFITGYCLSTDTVRNTVGAYLTGYGLFNWFGTHSNPARVQVRTDTADMTYYGTRYLLYYLLLRGL